jgi:hypothetical protein
VFPVSQEQGLCLSRWKVNDHLMLNFPYSRENPVLGSNKFRQPGREKTQPGAASQAGIKRSAYPAIPPGSQKRELPDPAVRDQDLVT